MGRRAAPEFCTCGLACTRLWESCLPFASGRIDSKKSTACSTADAPRHTKWRWDLLSSVTISPVHILSLTYRNPLQLGNSPSESEDPSNKSRFWSKSYHIECPFSLANPRTSCATRLRRTQHLRVGVPSHECGRVTARTCPPCFNMDMCKSRRRMDWELPIVTNKDMKVVTFRHRFQFVPETWGSKNARKHQDMGLKRN